MLNCLFEKKFVLVFFLMQNVLLISWRFLQPTSLIFDQALIVIVFSIIFYFLFLERRLKSPRENLVPLIRYRLIASGMLFLIWILLVPGTVERSRSLAIFKWVQFGNSSHTISQIEEELIEAYDGFDMPGFRLRLHEQQVRGLMHVSQSEVVTLTFSGTVVYKAAELSAVIYRLNGWYEIPLGPSK